MVSAVHEPSGTRYGGITRADGRFVLPGMRVGGPYTVTVSFIGFATEARQDVFLNLGVASNLSFQLQQQAVAVGGITVTSEADAIFSTQRTGAGTAIGREALEALPSIVAGLATSSASLRRPVGFHLQVRTAV